MGAAALVAAGVSFGRAAAAAPPQTVGYHGTRVTTAIPAKPFTLSFQVKNTSSETYSGVQVTFHIPNGLQVTKVAPANAVVQDDLVYWTNVPIAPGKSFWPTLTMNFEAGTPVKTKKTIWMEVTGTDMEATSTNFSITAVSANVVKVGVTLTSADIKSMFLSVYGRVPTGTELSYWLGRRADKPGRGPLQGAMAFHKAVNIKH